MRKLRHALCRRQDDEGAVLVIALVFVVVVGLFALAALGRSQGATLSGTALFVRGEYQYALDGGVERAYQVLQQDLSTGSPTYCTSPSSTPTSLSSSVEPGGTFTLNNLGVNYSCQDLAGTTASSGGPFNTDFSVVVTGCGPSGSNQWTPTGCINPAADAFTTQSSVGTSGKPATCGPPIKNLNSSIVLHGSVYLAGAESPSDIKNPVLICGTPSGSGYLGGDLVQPTKPGPCVGNGTGGASDSPGSIGSIAPEGPVYVDPRALVACTGQTVVQAIPDVDPKDSSSVLPSLPLPGSGTCIALNPTTGDTEPCSGSSKGGYTCDVFYPGTYGSAIQSQLLSGNGTADYFASGTYSFQDTGDWSGSQMTVLAGLPDKKPVNDSPTNPEPVPSSWAISGCAGMNDSTAGGLKGAPPPGSIGPGGVEWIFGGSSTIEVNGSSSFTLFDTSTKDHPDLASNTVIAVPETANGYEAWSSAGSGASAGQFINMASATASLNINGKVVAPSAASALLANNPSQPATITGGIVMGSLSLQASGAAALQPNISTPSPPGGGAPPPFRTVRVIASDASGASTIVDCAIANIYNSSPWNVQVISWQTADSVNGGIGSGGDCR